MANALRTQRDQIEHKYNVLIIDDCEDICDLLESLLQKEGHSTFSMQLPEKCEELIVKENIDIAIIDLILPKVDGLATILSLQKSFPGLKLIALSGDVQRLDNEVGFYDACIKKPFELKDIIAAFSECYVK